MATTPVSDIRCLHCGRAAALDGRYFLHGPDGAVERREVRCGAGHCLAPLVARAPSRWTAKALPDGQAHRP
jgi:hypothetical protein